MDQQGVALTGRNRTGPPFSVGLPTAQAPGGRPARLPAALQTTIDDRGQRAKQHWPVRGGGASNNRSRINACGGPKSEIRAPRSVAVVKGRGGRDAVGSSSITATSGHTLDGVRCL